MRSKPKQERFIFSIAEDLKKLKNVSGILVH